MPQESKPDPFIDAPLRPVRLGRLTGKAVHRADGSVLLRCGEQLEPHPDSWLPRLIQWGEREPDRVFLTESAPDGGRRALTFGQALKGVRSVAQALCARGLGSDRPIAILAENRIDTALMTLGALYAGIPASPISPAYALLTRDFQKLSGVMASLPPGLVYVSDGRRYAEAVHASVPAEIEIISAQGEVAGRRTTPFQSLLDTPPGPESEAARRAVTGDTVAKIMFTSGSSGIPKPVTIPHRMLASNRQQAVQGFRFFEDEPPVFVDWLPWHHTFGGNSNLGFALWCGGTLHIDDGRPTPEAIGATVDLIKRAPPTAYFSTPAVFEALVRPLREDAVLREKFFSRLKLILYGAALLPRHVWQAIDELAVSTIGARVMIISGLGSTECGPVATLCVKDQRREPQIGLPLPGMDTKLAPVEGRLELRMRGPSVTPGYWRRPDLTAAAFDEEGYFKLGDAIQPLDPNDFAQGIVFDGRLSDNFKLANGTWVQANVLRTRLVAAMAPLFKDAVIAGQDRNYVTAIGFADVAACRALTSLPQSAPPEKILAAPEVRDALKTRLSALAAQSRGGSERIARLVIELEHPSFDNGELTDKATASARSVLLRRAHVVDELYEESPSGRTHVAAT